MPSLFLRELLATTVAGLGRPRFYRLQGMIVSAWAIIETCLDEANHVAWRHTDGAIAKEIPVNFKRKVKLFQKAHRELEILRPLAAEGEIIVSMLNRLMEDRHNLVHGFLRPAESGLRSWTVYRNTYGPEGLGLVSKRYTPRELRLISDELVNLLAKTADYAERLLAIVRQHKLHNDGGERSS